MTLAEIRKYVFPGERGIACLARVDGVSPPRSASAICRRRRGPRGRAPSRAWTRRFRGRGLGRLVKEHVHHRAHELGMRRLTTDNEEHNEGIRRLNAELGLHRRRTASTGCASML